MTNNTNALKALGFLKKYRKMSEVEQGGVLSDK